MGFGLGSSSAATRLAVGAAHLVAPKATEANAYFSQYVGPGKKILEDWLVFEVLGVFLGGLVGAYSAGRLKSEVIRGEGVSKGRRIAMAVVGGILMGFAARLARGCTSGQALTGGAILSLGSWIFMMCVFAGGYLVAPVRQEGLAMNLLPLYPHDVFGFPTGLLLGTLIGFAFGFVLERAGFGNAKNLAAQFYLTDTRVLKVMFSAIATACAGIGLLAGFGVLDLSLLTVPETFIGPHVVGGLLLGIGFIVSGYCPGTGVVAMASGKWDGLLVDRRRDDRLASLRLRLRAARGLLQERRDGLGDDRPGARPPVPRSRGRRRR